MDHAIQNLTVSILPIIFAITMHEAAHGYVARYFGDPTAYLAGRVSLNPVRHIDPIGTVLLPAVTLLLTGMMFGYAKPVPVNFGNLRQPKRDMRWVALAGPAANLAMAVLWMVLFKIQVAAHVDEGFFELMSIKGVWINTLFMVLNLIPIPPLDGGRVAFSLMPAPMAIQYARLEPFGIPLVFLIIWLSGGVLLVPARAFFDFLNHVI
jgi:Zn-dependent protease